MGSTALSLSFYLDGATDALRPHALEDLELKPELELRDIIAAHLEAGGARVTREARYPSSARRRCDILVDDAWVELKRATHSVVDTRDEYAHRFLHEGVLDVVKLATDGGVLRALFIGMLFDDEDRAQSIGLALAARCLAEGLPISLPQTRSFPILDCGNPSCTLVGIEVGTT